jgi:hypothetical protein
MLTVSPNLQVLWKTFGREILMSGLFKLLWSVFVIMVRRRVQAFGSFLDLELQHPVQSFWERGKLGKLGLPYTCSSPLLNVIT